MAMVFKAAESRPMRRPRRSRPWQFCCSLIGVAVLVSSCSASGSGVATAERSRIDDTAPTPATGGEPRPVDVPEPSPTLASSTTDAPPTNSVVEEDGSTGPDPTASPVTQFGTGRPIEPIDPASDPVGWRRARPVLPREPIERWRVRFERFTLAHPVAVGEVVIHVAVTPENEQTVVALSKTDGSIAWTLAIDGFRVANLQVVGGVVVTEWNAPGNETILTGSDPARGDELWREVNRPVYPEIRPLPNLIDELDRAYAPEATALDPRTLDPIGTHQRGLVGPRGPLRLDGNEVFELDPVTFDVIDSVRLDRPVDDFESLTIVPYGVVAYEEGELLVYDRSGRLSTQLPVSDVASPQLVATGPDSNVVVAVFDSEFEMVGLDIAASEVSWIRAGIPFPLGRIDGEQHAVVPFYDDEGLGLPDDVGVELFSMVTGESRCIIEESASLTQHGFFGESGTAYDLDCNAVWNIDVDADTSKTLVDGGVLTWRRVEDEVELAFFG